MSNYSFQNKLLSMTTMITNSFGQATGFFYCEVENMPQAKNKNGHWVRYDKFWLVTNKHVVLSTENSEAVFANNFIFRMREICSQEVKWIEIQLSTEELNKRCRFDKDDKIDISDLINEYIKPSANHNYIYPLSLTSNNLPQNQPLNIEVTDDIIVASYPKGFYDEQNKFPIIKSGIIASGWNLNFRGLPMFEIDAQLFPGSSGGLVISKPKDIAIINGRINTANDKQFILLGIYSGEYLYSDNITKEKKSYGLGNVWYSYLIDNICKNGIAYSI